MRVLVTGGSGFIGRSLVNNFLELGYEVKVADLVRPKVDVSYIEGDLRNNEVVSKAFLEDLDAVVHLAALTRVIESTIKPVEYLSSNVTMLMNILEQIRLKEIPKLVFASTNAVVGNIGDKVINEMFPLNPLSPYGGTKAAGEMLISSYSHSFGFDATSLRFTNVYGIDMESKDSLIARIMKAISLKTQIEVYGSGNQVRDYVYISDVVNAICLGLDLKGCNTLSIGSGVSTSVNEILKLIENIVGNEIDYFYGSERVGEMKAVRVDISHAKELGFSPNINIEEGLKLVSDWWPEK